MLRIIVGALIAGVVGFISSWAILRLNAKKTEELTLRLRALELQEPALRWLSRVLYEVSRHEDFVQHRNHQEGLPGPEVTETGELDLEWKTWMGRGRRAAHLGVDLINGWDSEHDAAVFDDGVRSAMQGLAEAQDRFGEALEEVRDWRTWSPEKGETLVDAAAVFFEAASKARNAAESARRVT